MGYWGAGIFDNDHALCTLNDLIDPFVDLVEKNAANPATSEWDEILIDELIISGKILMTLKAEGLPLERFPRSDVLIQNRDAFAKKWRETPGIPDLQIERLSGILEVWDQLISASQNHGDEDGG